MERALFHPERITEFGANPFAVEDDHTTFNVHGARAKTLKAGVQAKCENVPGVYGMLDDHGVLIYVGKSKQLRTRLLTYFSPKARNQKPGRLIRQTKSILWEPGPSEFAALLRELQLIQHWQPRFNVKDMPRRNRSTYVCLGRPKAPGVMLAAQPTSHILARFGPVWGGGGLRRAVEVINRVFSLRDCPNSQPMVFADQPSLFDAKPRPGCLRFEMQTCLGPCVRGCSKESYFEKVSRAEQFLNGQNDNALSAICDRMERAANSQQFELAARLRDDLAAVMRLRDRLARVRKAEENDHFIYEIPTDHKTLWYVIRGGRVAHVTHRPQTPTAAKSLLTILDKTYRSQEIPQDLTRIRPDTLLLVTSWFQQNPEELRNTLPPDEAREVCESKLRRTKPK